MSDSLTLGIVGLRSYEVYAWQATGSVAVEEAYWSHGTDKGKDSARKWPPLTILWAPQR